MVDATRDRLAEATVVRATSGLWQGSVPLYQLAFGWILAYTFVFFSGHGYFSFQFINSAASRNVTFVGTYILPGAAYSIVLWAIVSRLRGVTSLALRMPLLVALPLLAILSTMWSQNPPKTLSNSVALLLDTMFAFYLVANFEAEDLMRLTMMGGIAVAVLGLFVIVVFPEFGVSHLSRTEGAWQGLFIDRTASAKGMVFLISPAIALWRKNFTWGRACYLALMVVFILKGEAVTAIFVMGVYTMWFAALHGWRAFERKTALVITLIGLPILLVLGLIGYRYLGEFLALFHRDLTLTGRTEIWDSLLRSVAKRPWFGYGFYAFWEGLAGESANAILAAHWVFGYAHNGYLEIVLQIGLVGGAIFLATFVQAIGNAIYCVRRGSTIGTEWYTGILIMTLIYNFSEGTVLWPHDLLSILYVMACCGLANAARQIRARSAVRRSAPGRLRVFTREEALG